MRLEYFRYLLSPLKQSRLAFVEELSREEVIRKIFSSEKIYTFPYGRNKGTFGFVTKLIHNKKAFGRIGRQKKTKLHLSPAEGFQEKQEEDWPGSHIFINLDDEKTTGQTEKSGQVIAIQSNRAVISNPTNCLRALADKINQEVREYGYYLTINPILQEKKNFWSVVDKYDGHIKKVVLIYTPPNLFELKNKLEDDLKRANENFNTTKTEIVLENNSGDLRLPRENRLLKESAEYVDQGGGGYIIRMKDGKEIIKSEEGVETKTFEGKELNIEGASKEDLARIIHHIFNS